MKRFELAAFLILSVGVATAHADTKTILDIDQCLDNRKKAQDGLTVKAQLDCVEQPFAGQPTPLKELLRLCEHREKDPVDFRSYVRQNSFRVNLDIIDGAIGRACDKRAQDADAKAALAKEQERLHAKMDVLLEAIHKAVDESLYNASKGDAARTEFGARAAHAKRAADKAMKEKCVVEEATGTCSNPNDPTQKAFEAADRNRQVASWVHGKVRKTADDQNADYTGLVLIERCVTGYNSDILVDIKGVKIKDSVLADADEASRRMGALQSAIDGPLARTRADGKKLDDVLSKWGGKPDTSKADAEAMKSHNDAMNAPGYGIREGDGGYEACSKFMGAAK